MMEALPQFPTGESGQASQTLKSLTAEGRSLELAGLLAHSLGAGDERTVPAGKGNYTVANPSEIAVFSSPYLAAYGAARLNCLIASGRWEEAEGRTDEGQSLLQGCWEVCRPFWALTLG